MLLVDGLPSGNIAIENGHWNSEFFPRVAQLCLNLTEVRLLMSGKMPNEMLSELKPFVPRLCSDQLQWRAVCFPVSIDGP